MAASKEQKTSHNENRRRSKRPEIQRYVPKGKILEQQLGVGEEETWIDGVDDSISPGVPGPRSSQQHSPSPQPVSSPSPRKIDLKSMQVTVVNDPAADSPTAQTKIASPSASSRSGSQQQKHQQNKPGTPSQSPSQSKPTAALEKHAATSSNTPTSSKRITSPNPSPTAAAASTSQPVGQGQGQQHRGQLSTRGQRPGQRGGRNGNVGTGYIPSRGRGRHFDETTKEENRKPQTHPQNQDLYIVPSRPNTIGQEADRTATIGKEDNNKVTESEAGSAKDDTDPSLVNRFSKTRPNRSKSKSFDRLNKTERWDEEDYYTDPAKLGTLVFERSRSSDQLNLSDKKPPMPRQGSLTKTPKKYSFSAMRRPRADSFSSDISTGTGSDWSTEDLDFDKDVDTKILDWDKEVERELALQVQDETQKMTEWLERQESGGLSQVRSDHPTVDMSGEGERCNTLPFDSKHKKRVQDEKRGRKKERRRGSFDMRSRDSSVASVQSVQSVQSAYSGEGRRRRRRRRKSSSGSAYSAKMRSGSSDTPRNMNIKVTCAQNNRREVKVDAGSGRDEVKRDRDKPGHRGGGGNKEVDSRGSNDQYHRNQNHPAGRQRHRSREKVNKEKEVYDQDHQQQGRDAEYNRRPANKQNEPFYPRENPRERWNRNDNQPIRQGRGKPGWTSPNMDKMGGTSPKGGGLLHIPAAATHPNSQSNQQHHNSSQSKRHAHSSHQGHHQGQYDNHQTHHPDQAYQRGGRGRNNSGGSRKKTLFDPNNPSKPIVISPGEPGLHFKDTDEHYSASPGSPQYPDPEMMSAAGHGYRPPPPFYPPPGYMYGYNGDPHYPQGPPPVPPPGMMRAGGPGADRMYYSYPPGTSSEGNTGYQEESYFREPYYQE